MKEALEELRKDFKEAVSCIDFGQYNPYSKAFMTAGFIGQMWYLLKMLCEDDDVEAEIDGAKVYMQKFEETGDTVWRDMAKDELRHAGILIKKHYEWADDKEKVSLEAHENERQELLKKLEKEK